MLYAYPKLSQFDFGFVRLFGPGLCNLLFPWARSILAANKYGLKPISPTWFQLKLGTVLRREADTRFYSDLFKSNPEEISGIRKPFILLTYPKVAEDYVAYLKSDASPNNDHDKIVVFSGLKDYFNSILKEHTTLFEELVKIARDEHKAGLGFNFGQSISVHIRLGDFKVRNSTPIQWYIKILRRLRSELGSEWPIYVFSDGIDEELMPVMQLPNTRRLTFGSSLADLFALSKAHILVGTAGSTFSQWASFLGRMPVIWPKDGLTHCLYYDKPLLEIENVGEKNLPEQFVLSCKQNAD